MSSFAALRAHSASRSFTLGCSALLLTSGLASGQDRLIGTWPDPAAPAGNPFDGSSATLAAIDLGAMLFWDEQLSSDNTMSCGTCHRPEAGGAEFRATGAHPVTGHEGSFGMLPQDLNDRYFQDPLFGVERRVTPVNSPSAINSAFFETLFWDARSGPDFEDGAGMTLPGFEANAALEQQASIPPIGGTEMAHDGLTWAAVEAKLSSAEPLRMATNLPADLAAQISAGTTYDDLFNQVYGGGVTRERVSMALATYQRSLVSDQAPFDTGQMTLAQQNGFDLFKTAPTRNQFARTCASCHSTDLFDGFLTDGQTGALLEPNDNLFSDGLRHQTRTSGNAVPFKTPSLRNVGLRKGFMHDGGFASLSDVLDFYNSPAAKFGFEPALSAADLADVQDFLENALTDPRVASQSDPFDRPTLWTETVPFGTNHYGQGTNDPIVPDPILLANAPPFQENGVFKIGVGGANPGAFGRLGISPGPGPGPFGPFTLWIDPATVTWTVLQNSVDGTATAFLSLPSIVGGVGPFYAQWGVVDPSAMFGAVLSDAAEFVRF